MFFKIIIAILFSTSFVDAQPAPQPPRVLHLQNSGSDQGTVNTINVTGSATASVSGQVGTINVSGSSSAITGLTGDVTASGPGNVAATLATVNSNVGTFQGITVNGKGLVTAATNQGYITGNQTITASGDATGSGTTTLPLTLATVNSNVGTYTNATVTVNGKGLVTAASSGTAYVTSAMASYIETFQGGL